MANFFIGIAATIAGIIIGLCFGSDIGHSRGFREGVSHEHCRNLEGVSQPDGSCFKMIPIKEEGVQ